MVALPNNRQFADAGALVAAAIADALRPAPPMDLGAWAEANIVFSADEPMPGKYNLDKFPFYRRILHVLGNEHPARSITLRKSAQIGGTIIGDVFLLGWLELAPGIEMCVHPTLPQGRAWVNNKIKPHVRKSPSLSSILSFDNPKDGKATELLFERLDARGTVIVTGANSAASLSQHSAKVQLQDDLSKWENNDAGDPEDQANSRSRAFEDAKIFKVGTPMTEGACRIDRNFKAGTQEFYHVPCPQCGHLQPLDWDNFQRNVDAAAADPERLDDGAFFTCAAGSDCGFPIEEKHRAWCIDPANGAKWVAHNPGARDVSFHLWAAYAPLTSWARIAAEYLAAKGDPAKERTVLNDGAGLPYRMQGEAPEWELLQRRGDDAEFVRGRIASGYYFLIAGADVQADRVEFSIWAFGPDLRRQPVDHIVVPGRIAEAEMKKALDEVMVRGWPDAYGNLRQIEHLMIDVGYERQHTLDWVKQYGPSRITPIVGAQEDNAPAIGTQQTRESTMSGRRVKAARVVFRIGGSMLKSFLYSDLRKTDPLSRGFVALGQGFDAKWYEGLASETRQPVKNKAGRTVWGWTVLPGRRNEVLDCSVYAHAAAEHLGWKRLQPAQWQAIMADRDRKLTNQTDLFTVDRSETVQAAPAAAAPAPAATDDIDADDYWGTR